MSFSFESCKQLLSGYGYAGDQLMDETVWRDAVGFRFITEDDAVSQYIECDRLNIIRGDEITLV